MYFFFPGVIVCLCACLFVWVAVGCWVLGAGGRLGGEVGGLCGDNV